MPSLVYELPADAMPILRLDVEITETERSSLLHELNKSYAMFCEKGKGTFFIQTPLTHYECPVECEFELLPNPSNIRDPSVVLSILRPAWADQGLGRPHSEGASPRSLVASNEARRLLLEDQFRENEESTSALDAALEAIRREYDENHLGVLAMLGETFIRLCELGRLTFQASDEVRRLRYIGQHYSEFSFLARIDTLSIAYSEGSESKPGERGG